MIYQPRDMTSKFYLETIYSKQVSKSLKKLQRNHIEEIKNKEKKKKKIDRCLKRLTHPPSLHNVDH